MQLMEVERSPQCGGTLSKEKEEVGLCSFKNNHLNLLNGFLMQMHAEETHPLYHPYLLLLGYKVIVKTILSGGGCNSTRGGHFLFAGPHQREGSGNRHGAPFMAFVCINNSRVTRHRGNFQKPRLLWRPRSASSRQRSLVILSRLYYIPTCITHSNLISVRAPVCSASHLPFAVMLLRV